MVWNLLSADAVNTSNLVVGPWFIPRHKEMYSHEYWWEEHQFDLTEYPTETSQSALPCRHSCESFLFSFIFISLKPSIKYKSYKNVFLGKVLREHIKISYPCRQYATMAKHCVKDFYLPTSDWSGMRRSALDMSGKILK